MVRFLLDCNDQCGTVFSLASANLPAGSAANGDRSLQLSMANVTGSLHLGSGARVMTGSFRFVSESHRPQLQEVNAGWPSVLEQDNYILALEEK